MSKGPVVLTEQIVREILAATGSGADLRISSATAEQHDTAFTLGLLPGRQAVFAYLSTHMGPAFTPTTRFQVEAVEVQPSSWVLHARQEGRGSLEIEVRPVASEARSQIKRWIEQLPDDAIAHAAETLKTMLEPRAL